MKKRLICLLLSIVLLLGCLPVSIYALDPMTIGIWPCLSATAARDIYGSMSEFPAAFKDKSGSIIQLVSAGDWARLIDVSSSENGVFSPEDIYSSSGTSATEFYRTRIRTQSATADYSQVQNWIISDYLSDRYFYYPIWAFSSHSDDTNSLDRKSELWKLAPRIYYVMQQFDNLFLLYSEMQDAESIAYGGKHPSDLRYLTRVALGIQEEFSIHSGFGINHEYQLGKTGWHDLDNLEQLKEYWEKEYKWDQPGFSQSTITSKEVDILEFILDVVAPYYIELFKERTIKYPEITSFVIGTSKGLVDAENSTVTIRIPNSVNMETLPEPEIETPEGVKAVYFAGGVQNGRILYSVVPWDYSTGVTYDGIDEGDEAGYGYGVDLSKNWTVIVENGNPFNLVTSFSVMVNGVERCGNIVDAEGDVPGRIMLNLPVGTDLSKLIPSVKHTGEYYTLGSAEAGSAVDFTNSAEEPVKLVVFNTEYSLRTEYDVTITAERSAENQIISYSIDGAEGVIQDNRIEITIPFATDLSSVQPDIVISEFAELIAVPESLHEGDNTYVIRAENGAEREYTVSITRTHAATESRILSFKCGGYSAEINHALGTITLELPSGSPTSFAPAIELSPFAVVSPDIGTVCDFRTPVKFTVTAQDGSSSVYTVTVTFAEEPADNPYKSSLESIVDKIIGRYRTAAKDDWEWMDLGLYENLIENTNSGYNYDFVIADRLSDLDVTTNVAMTNIARKVLMLTARGFNCTKLSEYNSGNPYKDSKGNDVDDLVRTLYNYAGDYTINGPVFALLALDMGNYTVPEDAKWTRNDLLDMLLNHKYLSDGFGIDMVGAIMYAIAPYQDDPLYGERVKLKLNEGLDLILDNMSDAYSFDSMGATNSESAGWVMMALCSMGIDWNVDPRFSNGQGQSGLQNWMDNFANVGEGYFHHTTSVRNNALATYEGCYASMWYLGFLEHGGQGSPYYFYYNRFDFGEPLSSDASILSFELEGKQGVIEEGAENSITVTLSNGTPLTNMKPEIELAEGAKLIAPSLPVTFVEGVPQPFTVCAEDGKTYKTYFVTVVYDDVLASGAELDTDSIVLQNSVLNDEAILSKTVTTASDGATEILLTVKPGVNTSKMYLRADISYAAACDPVLDGSKQLDLSDWLTVTVTSEDGTNTNVYRIKVVAKGQAEITSFEVEAGGIWYSGAIDNVSNTIAVRDVDDSNLSSTVLETRIVFTGLTCSPTSGVATDFASSVIYTLGGSSELASRSYTVTVLNKSGQHITANSGSSDPSGGTDDPSEHSGGSTASGVRILGLTVLGKEAVIDQNIGTIVITLPKGTDVSAVALDITLSEGASSDPSSGQIVDLSAPLTIKVKNGEEARQYVISVVLERSISEKLWDEMLEESDVVDHQVSHGRGIN